MITLPAVFALLTWLMSATLKGSVIILIVALLHALFGSRIDARWRHALWIVVLLRLTLPVAPESSWSIFNLFPGQEVGAPRMRVLALSPVPVPAGMRTPRVEVLELAAPKWLLMGRWLVSLWLGVALLLAVRTTAASLRLHLAVVRTIRRSPPRADLQEILDEGRKRLGIRRRLRIVESDVVKTPALHGLVRPTLLLPTGLAEDFTRDELRHVVLHELWHLRRFDVAVSWILSAVQTLHWFNPFVWFAASRIREERELACDELALSCLEEDERTGYGQTILKLLERFRAASPVPALVGIVNHKQKMKRRLTMIASFQNRTRFSILFVVVATMLGLVSLTDAEGGARSFHKSLDPAAMATIEKLEGRLTLDLKNASFNDLLSAVSTKTGLVVTQSPEIATNAVQQARFTVTAENIPAHCLLAEALSPFGVMPSPEASGVVLTKGEACLTRMTEGEPKTGQRMIIRKEKGSDMLSVSDEGVVCEKRVFKHAAGEGSTPEGGQERVFLRRHADGEDKGVGDKAEERIFVRRLDPAATKIGADGTIRREVKLHTEENGVKSEGRLTLEISPK